MLKTVVRQGSWSMKYVQTKLHQYKYNNRRAIANGNFAVGLRSTEVCNIAVMMTESYASLDWIAIRGARMARWIRVVVTKLSLAWHVSSC